MNLRQCLSDDDDDADVVVPGIAVNAAAADRGGADVDFPALVDAEPVRPDAARVSPVAAAAASCVVAGIFFPVLVKAGCLKAWGMAAEVAVKHLSLGHHH